MSIERMAAIAYPDGHPWSGCLYFFREGWNPSEGTRFMELGVRKNTAIAGWGVTGYSETGRAGTKVSKLGDPALDAARYFQPSSCSFRQMN